MPREFHPFLPPVHYTTLPPQTIPAVFHLPSIDAAIPRQLFFDSLDDHRAFGRDLLRAGIIDPETIPDTANNVVDLIQAGLSAWLNQQIGVLHTVEISMRLMDANSVKQYFSFTEFQRPINGGYFLAVVGDLGAVWTMEEKALEMETHCPGLVQSALVALQEAMRITVWIQAPYEIFDLVNDEYWQCPGCEPSDEQARDFLDELFGDQDGGGGDSGDGAKPYLPSVLLPALGGSLFRVNPNAQVFSAEQLLDIAAHSPNALSASVAEQITRLVQCIALADAENAQLPDLNDIWATTISRGCHLMYRADDTLLGILDNHINHLFDCGEGTEFHGLAEIPADPADIINFFNHIKLALAVLQEMDQLILLISKKWTHYES